MVASQRAVTIVTRPPAGVVSLLRRAQKWGAWFHFGIGLPDGRVVHLPKTGGLRTVNFDEFAEGQRVYVLRCVSREDTPAAINRIRHAFARNRRYDLVAWNCETFARFVAEGKPGSLEVFFVLFSLGALFALSP